MSKTARGHRLLLVDDDRWLLESMTDWLGGQGFSVSGVTRVADAKEQLREAQFDVALLDINLDGEDGYELLAWCRKKFPELPVVMITGYAGPDAGVEAVAA
ncbi:MAG: response regulator, partial [Aureliella sp.]